MQFVDGGNIDSHASVLWRLRLRACWNGGVVTFIGTVRVAFDGTRKRMGICSSLGGEEQVGIEEWIEFREDMKVSADEERRAACLPRTSDLDVCDVAQPAEDHDDLATFGSATSP